MAGKIESGNSFKFIGKVIGDEKSFREVNGANYTIASMKMSIQCGTNRHFLECVGFKPKDTNKKLKYFFTDMTKGEVSYANRMSIDTEHLAFMHPSIKTDDSVYRFISDYDYVIQLKNMLDKNEFNDNVFEVSGNITYENYYNKDGEFKTISKYRPTKFVKVDSETEPLSVGVFNIYLGDDCFEKVGDVGVLTGKSVIRNKNKDVDGTPGYEGYDTSIIIPLGDNQPDTVFEIYKKKFEGNDRAMNRIGIYANIINGVEEVPFDESMLTEEERTLISLGMETIDNIKASKGSGKGGFIREIVRIREARGYGDGVKESVLDIDDLDIYIKENTVSGQTVFNNKRNNADSETISGENVFDDIF